MATQLLFYEAAVPVTAARHGNWSIEPRDYSFSKGINSVPLTAVEFPAAVGEYAVVFAGKPGALMPTAILGLRNAENLYVDQKGEWDARYVPAFVRRYPFVFSSADAGRNFTLCIDESYAGFNQEGRGERLFTEEKASAYTQKVLDFLRQYQLEFQRTQRFCRKLEELELLQPMQAQVTAGAEKMSLAGFLAVDRKRLKALPADKLADLVQTDGMELVYLHLHSLRNFSRMPERIGGTASAQAAAEPAQADTAPPARRGRRKAEEKQAS